MAANSKRNRRRGPGRPFVKGQSGNPRGRPKIDKPLREMCQDAIFHGGFNAIKAIAVGARKARDRLAAWKLIAEYGFGKPPEHIEVTGEVRHVTYRVVIPRTSAGAAAAESREAGRGTVQH